MHAPRQRTPRLDTRLHLAYGAAGGLPANIMTLSISELDTTDRRAVNRFIDLPFRLYRDNPYWVPPIVDDTRLMLNRGKNPYYAHSDAAFFVAASAPNASNSIRTC